MTTAAPTNSIPETPLSGADMAELLGAFNDATARLHAAHESLRLEVARLQEELRQANEQIERSRRLAALGEMAAGIAHEIRNPIGSIGLYARMLEEDLRSCGREAERTHALKISAAVRTVNGVVGDVLAFAREVRISAGPASVDGLFTRAIDEALGGEGPPVRVDRVDQRSAVREIFCDAGLMQRAIVNIVSNAVQAMREHGGAGERVLTTDARVRSVKRPDGSEWSAAALVVADTGPGIPEGVMERMFNPFFTTRATGTGLGLAIVHRIVDAHGGQVAVRNIGGAPGRGAVVELLLPVGAGQGSIGRGKPRSKGRRTRTTELAAHRQATESQVTEEAA